MGGKDASSATGSVRRPKTRKSHGAKMRAATMEAMIPEMMTTITNRLNLTRTRRRLEAKIPNSA